MTWQEFKTKFGIKDEVKGLGWELLLTLSHKKSLLSSKRLERFSLFASSLSMCIIYFGLHIHTITVTEMLLIVGTLLAYAGFTMVKTEKEKLPNSTTDGEQGE